MRLLVLVTCLVGGLAATAAWSTIHLRPAWVDAAAFDFVAARVSAELEERFPASFDFANEPPASVLSAAIRRDDAARLREAEAVRRAYGPFVEAMLLRTLDDVCRCRSTVDAASPVLRAPLPRPAERAIERLERFARRRSQHDFERLRRALEIVTGTLALLFATTFGIALSAVGRARAMVAPAALLLLSTVACAYAYFVEQDWVHAFLFAEYVDTGFVVYVVLVYALIVDLGWNRGRIVRGFFSP